MLDVHVLLLCFASLFAGAMDAMVGGGALILLPAMLLGLPQKSIATILGTEKLAAVFGTAAAAHTYVRHHPVRAAYAGPMMLAGLVGAVAGATTATQLSTETLKPFVLFVLAAVWVFTLLRKDLGAAEGETVSNRRSLAIAICGGLGIGFYDGLIGPGTGSFLLFLLILGEGASFIRASSTAKLVNTATNVGALLLFALTGHVMYLLGSVMAIFGILGSVIGSRLAIRMGSRFVRIVFLVTVAALIARLAIDVL
jgi:uncharacterized membrane protein YfcA